MANDRDREMLSRLMQAYDESFGERCSDRTVQVLATYREEIEAKSEAEIGILRDGLQRARESAKEIEARYAGVVEALLRVVNEAHDPGSSPAAILWAREALAKIGRG